MKNESTRLRAVMTRSRPLRGLTKLRNIIDVVILQFRLTNSQRYLLTLTHSTNPTNPDGNSKWWP